MMKILLALVAAFTAVSAQAQSCTQPGPSSERAARLAEIAMGEYRAFNGHRIDAQGRLWKFGNVETETEPLREERKDGDRFAWRRVWRYWQTLDQHVPGTLDFRRMTWAEGLLDDPANAGPQRMTNLRELLASVPADNEAAREALVRATISDTPWSGAFISFLMDRAGFSEAEFHFSGAHAVYIRPALEDAPGYAYRACDVRTSVPRVGDLICYGRAAKPLTSFAEWKAQATQLDSRVKSHCDLVVKVDRAAAKIETMGGNVEQSVTWRKLMLDADGHLSRKHLVARQPQGPNARECASDSSCTKSDMNQQHWAIVLQLR
ncbi:DUF2272 domain-containing protein [Burkholderiaceae bacterium UC74_6]